MSTQHSGDTRLNEGGSFLCVRQPLVGTRPEFSRGSPCDFRRMYAEGGMNPRPFRPLLTILTLGAVPCFHDFKNMSGVGRFPRPKVEPHHLRRTICSTP